MKPWNQSLTPWGCLSITRWLVTAAVCSVSASCAMAKGAKALPRFGEIERVVSEQFAALPDYQEADIVSKGEVKPIFPRLTKLGWKVADEKAILKQLLDDNNFLVQVLRTRDGKRFMRKVSKEQSVYDRLDRVAQHKRGPATIRRIIKLPDGEKYAKTDTGLNPNLSDLVLIYDRRSAQKRKLKDFGKPTGSIYTADELLDRLKESYKKAGGRSP